MTSIVWKNDRRNLKGRGCEKINDFKNLILIRLLFFSSRYYDDRYRDRDPDRERDRDRDRDRESRHVERERDRERREERGESSHRTSRH